MSVILTLSNSDVFEPEPQTLMDKLRHAYKAKSMAKFVWFPRVFLFALTVTLLYSLLRHLIPYYYKDSPADTIYYLKILACFLCINALANLVSCVCYDTTVPNTKDRPGLPQHMWEKPPDTFVPYLYNMSQTNGKVQREVNSGMDNVNQRIPGTADEQHKRDGMETKDGLPWTYCSICELDLPPRAVHCKLCNKCILKRDHHCFFTAVCIGHYNQRYFIMLCFYGMTYCGWGVYLTHAYVMEHFWSTVQWLDFFPPWSIAKTLIGSMSVKEFMMVHHLAWLSLFCFTGLIYSSAQFMLVTLNKTLYEFSKVDSYRSTTSVCQNFRSVFGDFWMLNFIFPTQIIFRQSDDGFHWEGLKKRPNPKYGINANRKK